MKQNQIDNIYIDGSVTIGKNVVIEPNNIIRGNTTIGDNCVVKSGNFIRDAVVEEGCTIEFSYIEESTISSGTKIGPYSRIRPSSKIGKRCKIGNFVEIKNSTLGDDVKASHLAYIGDAEIGNNCNIGCGAIFVNYDGKEKHRSIVGNNCFIGSNANIIAPIKVADGSFICAGTTLTIDTNENDFVIGRTRETIKPNCAKKYHKQNN